MAARRRGGPYRTLAPVDGMSGDSWSARLAQLRSRKALRRVMSPELSDSAIAVGGSGGPRGDVDVLVSFLAGRSHADSIGGSDEPRIPVQCRKAPQPRKGDGPALPVRWGFPEAPQTLRAEGKLPAEFAQLRMAHAHAVGWLYCLVRKPGVCVEREAVGLALDALVRLVGLPGLSVYVVGKAGTTMHIPEAAPVLDQLAKGLMRWVDGPAPVWLLQLAEVCLAALGWRDSFEGHDPECIAP